MKFSHNKKRNTAFIFEILIKELTKSKSDIFAKIKIDNISSIKAFEKAGYKKQYFLLKP